MTNPSLVTEARQLSSTIPIASIFVGQRRRRDYGNLDELSKDLKENGQITAITVAPPNEEALSDPEYAGQPWMLVAGGRRLAAAGRAGWTDIRALDREHLDPLKLRTLELAENLQRKDMDFVEVVRAKQEMYELELAQHPEITQAEVARKIGETPANFSRDLKVAEVLNQRPELKTASSKKAVLRAGKMVDHLEARVARDIVMGSTYSSDLSVRMVTADARVWLRAQPEARFDLLISDPPYGIDHYSQGHKTREGTGAGLSEYDDGEAVSLDLYVDIVPQLMRVTRRSGWIVLFQAEANYNFLCDLFADCCVVHCEYRDNYENNVCRAHYEGGPDCEFRKVEEPRWIWYRPNSQNNPRLPEEHAKNLYEHILVFNMGKGKLFRPCGNVLVHDADYGSRIHAMQKPVELIKDLISRFTLTGEAVCDPFFGSGALLKAAAQLARDFYGCELNPAMRGPALGYVGEDFNGISPRTAGQNETKELLDTVLGDFDEADADEMEALELES